MKGEYSVPNFVSPLAQDLIHKILNTNPITRFDIDKIKNHEWFKINKDYNFFKKGLIIGLH